jgi:hypothetical protein
VKAHNIVDTGNVAYKTFIFGAVMHNSRISLSQPKARNNETRSSKSLASKLKEAFPITLPFFTAFSEPQFLHFGIIHL